MKVFCSALASSAYYLTTAKYLQENFHGSLKNRKSLIFHIYIQYMYWCIRNFNEWLLCIVVHFLKRSYKRRIMEQVLTGGHLEC